MLFHPNTFHRSLRQFLKSIDRSSITIIIGKSLLHITTHANITECKITDGHYESSMVWLKTMFNHIYQKSFDIKTKLEIQYIKSFWKLYIPIWYSFLYLHQCTRSTIFPLCMHNISWVGQWHYFAHLWPLVCVVPFRCILHDQQNFFLFCSSRKKKKLWIQYLSPWSISTHFNFSIQTVKKENVNKLIIAIYIYILPFTLYQH